MSSETLTARFRAAARLIADAGQALAARGWTPATSSNFSARVAADRAAITISGRDKGNLSENDIMLIDLEGRAVGSDARPSAETLLHTQIYRRYPGIGAVLHTHSHTATVMSKLCAEEGEIRLEGYELLKAFDGYATHQASMVLPVFGNTQDMEQLAGEVDAYLDAGHRLHGYLIEGHGIYTWGRDMPEARRHLEAFEFLLACELELRRLKA